jgi:cell shape-determining protein MreC
MQFRKRNNTILQTIFFVIGIAFLFLFSRHIRSFLYQFVSPLTLSEPGYFFTSKQKFVRTIEELKTTLAEQSARMEEFSLLETENARLKELLGRYPDSPGILANIVASPRQSPYATLVLDAGSQEGISVGMSVSAFDATEIGTIDSVTEHASIVLLYSSPGREIAGTIVGGDDTTVTLVGRGAGEYEVRMPRELVFDPGMLIITQSVNPQPLAKIERVITDSRDPFQRLLAKIPINLQNTRWVIVR